MPSSVLQATRGPTQFCAVKSIQNDVASGFMNASQRTAATSQSVALNGTIQTARCSCAVSFQATSGCMRTSGTVASSVDVISGSTTSGSVAAATKSAGTTRCTAPSRQTIGSVTEWP